MNLIDRNKIESNTRRFTDADTEFRFLLGGIGTGSISVGNRGQLCDWEIFNKPNKNTPYPYTFFSLFSRFEGEKGEVRILESRLRGVCQLRNGRHSPVRPRGTVRAGTVRERRLVRGQIAVDGKYDGLFAPDPRE